MKPRRILATTTASAATLAAIAAVALADTTPQALPFSQNWSNPALITANDNWSSVPGVTGYLGNDVTGATGADPQTLTGAALGDVDVIANQTNPTTLSNGGVAEFDLADDTVALNGSGTADAPSLVFFVSTSASTSVNVAYNLRDLDASADNAQQQVALQYRVGSTGSFTNVPAGYVSDATTGGTATQVTPVSVPLPAAAAGQPEVQVRVITSNAGGNDEWVGVDDIAITGAGVPTPTPTPTETPTVTPTPTETPTVTPTPTVDPVTPISAIQGAAHVSPRAGTAVSNVNGIVTARRSNGFYMEDPSPDADPATSEGIFVFTGSAPPAAAAVGSLVSVAGTVSEFRPGGSGGTNNLSITQIGGSPTVTVVSTGATLPVTLVGPGGRVPPTEVIDDDANGSVETQGTFDAATDGIDFYESLEGMRLQVVNPKVVGTSASFGELPVVPGGGTLGGVFTPRGGILLRELNDDPERLDANPERVILDSELDASFVPATIDVGDTLTAEPIGVLDYSFGNFKLQVTQPVAFLDTSPAKEVGREPAAGELVVGNFNVENLDPGDGSRIGRLAGQVVNNLRSPDILALQEIQDNNGATNDSVVAADQSAQALIDAIVALGGPRYAYTDVPPVDDTNGGEPGGNIRVGYLYREDRGLRFVSRPGGSSTAGVTVVDGPDGPQLSASPGLVDPTNSAFNASRKPLAAEFTYNGQRVFVINNHFNSKGGDQPLFGRFQPPTRSSEVQRNEQARILNAFVRDLLDSDPGARVVVAGDLNDFEFSDTLEILTSGGVLTDLISLEPANERYDYVFDGNSQVLDHILVSDGLLERTEFDPVHVNAEYADQVSDHDPELAFIAAASCTVAGAITDNGPGDTDPAVNVIQGSAGSDYIRGDGDAELIRGLGADDVLCGGGGDDTILDGGGADAAFGEDGNDVVGSEAGDDAIDGGAGRDRVSYATRSAPVTATLGATGGIAGERDTLTGAEELTGGSAGDTLTGDDAGNTLRGNGGGDVLGGAGGADFVRGGDGADRASGGAGNDTVEGDLGDDVLVDGAGADQLLGGGDADEHTLSADGVSDNANCGDGPDRYRLGDRTDRVSRNCETRI